MRYYTALNGTTHREPLIWKMIETIKIETDDSSDGEHGQNRKVGVHDYCVNELLLSNYFSPHTTLHVGM